MEQQLTPQPKPTAATQGFALVLVLCALVLLTMLIVAYLSSVGTELQSSKNYASGAQTHQLADTALNLVIAQIKEATSGTNRVWTSQPGMIRTYDTQGALDKMYKLYSSNQWRTSGSFNPATDLPADWNQRPADYTDLNSPVLDGTGAATFPIMDGNLKVLTISGTPALSYDANGDGIPDIAGFSIPQSSVPTYDSTKLVSASNNPAPMPVQWMYLLSNGDINTASAASGTNQIVARVAFWTDDETSKVNINTASEGIFWDTPIMMSSDKGLAAYMVQAKEYQRYPGHPASTSLSAILTCQLPDPTITTGTAAKDLRNFIYGMSPRVSGRGSQGNRLPTASFAVSLDHDRLYDSVDELAFLPEVSGSAGPRYDMTTANLQTLRGGQLDWIYTSFIQSSTAGHPYTFTNSIKIDEQAVPKLRFFLTAQSRAPELNLMGRPRISLWPVDTRPDYISPTDKTLAFCSTIGGGKFYFQRQNPKSPTEDYNGIQRNQDLYANLKSILSNPIPGFGSNTFASKYPSGQSDQILTEMFDWIRSGVNLAYPDPALTPTTTGSVKQYAFYMNPTGTNAINTGSNATAIPPALPGSGQVVPIEIGNTRGFGRFPTVSKLGYALIMENQELNTPAAGQITLTMRFALLLETYVPMNGYAAYVPDYTISISGMQTTPPKIHVTGTDGIIVDQTLDVLDGSIHMDVPSNVEPYIGRAWGGGQGFFTPFLYLDNNYNLQPRNIHTTGESGYPFASNPLKFVISGTDATAVTKSRVSIDGFSYTLQAAYNDDTNTSHIFQTLIPQFPSVAGLAPPIMSSTGVVISGASGNSPLLQERINQICAVSQISAGDSPEHYRAGKAIITSATSRGGGDIVRGLELSHGDLRLLAVRNTESGTTKFVPHINYSASGTLPMAHSLLRPGGGIEGLEEMATKDIIKASHLPKRGVLITSSTFASSGRNNRPEAPSDASTITTYRNRGYFDFTTGFCSEGDGPLIMKPDEGNVSYGGYSWGESDTFPYHNQLFPFDTGKLSKIFSPNREISSAVQFGTLPTGAIANGTGTETPWQTLLFRPDLFSSHPGSAAPGDHLLLDLFWMPVVDPYPISEPFSTAGKINMNYQIMPFTYIRRDTGIRAALKSTRIMAMLPTDDQNGFLRYKEVDVNTVDTFPSSIYDMDVDKTLMFFDERFADSTQQAFKSPTEICNIPFVAKSGTGNLIWTGHPDNIPNYKQKTVDLYDASDVTALRSQLKTFWQYASLSGDNMMESPYNLIYPRLTTKSNTYTVHVRVQALKKIRGTPVNAFADPNDPNTRGIKDVITGEYRGSFVIERYIDPNDSRFKASDPAYVNPNTDSLDKMYKFRVLNTKQFAP